MISTPRRGARSRTRRTSPANSDPWISNTVSPGEIPFAVTSSAILSPCTHTSDAPMAKAACWLRISLGMGKELDSRLAGAGAIPSRIQPEPGDARHRRDRTLDELCWGFSRPAGEKSLTLGTDFENICGVRLLFNLMDRSE
jgi:hypothetical protein